MPHTNLHNKCTRKGTVEGCLSLPNVTGTIIFSHNYHIRNYLGERCRVRWARFNMTKIKGKWEVPSMWDGYDENYPFFADRSINMSSISRIGKCCFIFQKLELTGHRTIVGFWCSFCSFQWQPQMWQPSFNIYSMLSGKYRVFREFLVHKSRSLEWRERLHV